MKEITGAREIKLSSRKDPVDVLDYKEQITKIYFVRHGQTKANKLRLLFGQLDWDLNKEGIKQIKKAADKLYRLTKKEKINCILVSPLKRARHSARIIASKLKIKKTIIDKNLIEKSEGNWEGKNYWDVRKDDPENYFKWIRDPFKNKTPKGESVLDLNQRVKKFYNTITNKYLGKKIIVITHSGPIRLFLLNILGAEINKFWYLKLDCGSVTEVTISKKHAMITSFNK